MTNENLRVTWSSLQESFSFNEDISDFEVLSNNQSSMNNGLVRAILSVGIPEIDGATTPKEEVLGLLKLAAEVEHALMVQYLYAAHSVRGAPGRTISHIAVQEMGHLVTVNNLILSLTGINEDDMPDSLHMGRDSIRRTSMSNPIPFILEPVSRKALAKFVVTERPGIIHDTGLRQRVDALEAELGLKGIDANPVYALYAAIRWIFQENDTESELSIELGLKAGWHLKDSDFASQLDVRNFAAEPNEWGSIPDLVIQPVTNRKTALSAIDAIAEQGEGASDSDKSHFTDFLTVLDNYERNQFDVADMPISPYISELGFPEASKAQEITEPYTILWARLFSFSYELLLLDLGWGLSIPRSQPSRAKMIDVSINMMRLVLQPIADHLSTLPLTEQRRKEAGPNYQLRDETLPNTRNGYSQRYADTIARRDGTISMIENHPNFPADISGFLTLSSIQTIDNTRNPLLP